MNSIALTKKRKKNKRLISIEELIESKDLEGSKELQMSDYTVSLTHLETVYWPGEGITKGNLIQYYAAMAGAILPYLHDRPVILIRYPNGMNEQSFYQHDVREVPPFVRTIALEAEGGRTIDYIIPSNVETLLFLVNLGTMAQNPWHARSENIDSPDYIVFDLDPGPEAAFHAVRQTACALKEVLDYLGLESYPKTSGSRGMHVYVPVQPVYAFTEAAAFARQVSNIVAREHPVLATTERSISKRRAERVYIDHLQNARGKTVTSAYSVRAKPGAPVSTPLTWSEVAREIDPHAYTIMTVPQRLKRMGDPFEAVLSNRQSLEGAFRALQQLARPVQPRGGGTNPIQAQG